MSETDNIIFDTATRIFEDLSTPEVINAAEEGEWPQALWQAIEESGLTLTWIPEANGGVGASMLDGFAVIKAAGGAALPVPLAETLMAGWLLAKGGLEVTVEPMTVALFNNGGLDKDHGDLSWDGTSLSGTALSVPHARNAKQVVVVVDSGNKSQVLEFALPKLESTKLESPKLEISPHINLAGEPWDSLTFNKAVPTRCADLEEGTNASSAEALGALVRCVQAAGAMSTALELTIQYSMERVQFGRPIAKFQALQHSVAAFAGQVAAINAAADSAAEAVAFGNTIDHAAWVEIATAKTRLEEAVNTGAAIAHQVHGAMGFTYEHRLHHLTRRLWSWRDEYG
ncbi:MAG: acyl-CoA dehydrogenase, partial [Gammaproteobacteria bacterium]